MTTTKADVMMSDGMGENPSELTSPCSGAAIPFILASPKNRP